MSKNLKDGSIMKNLSLLFAASILYISSCTSGQYTASREYDDVYYSSGDKVQERQTNNNQNNQNQSVTPENSSAQEAIGNDNAIDNQQRFDYNNNQNNNAEQPDYTSTQERDGNTYITNNYYDNDDYYDYTYTSRMRRFNHPCGWSYYDSYYTNSYWYDYNPISYGVSIYLGYNFWHPYQWGPSWGFSIGYGSPWYNPWYSPYYGGGFGFNNGYWNGYQNGYWDGYYAGLYNGTFNPYYYNSYDNYSYYYGPRGGSNALNTSGTIRPVSQLYASVNTDRDKGNKASLNSEAAPFHNPKSIALQPAVSIPDVRDVKTIKSNVDIKGNNNGPSNDPRNPKGNTGTPSNDIKGIKTNPNVNTPIKDPVNVRDNDGKGNVPNQGTGGVKPGRDPKENQNVNPVPSKDPKGNQNSVTAPSTNPVKNNNIKNSTPRNTEPIRSTPSNQNNDDKPVRTPRRNDAYNPPSEAPQNIRNTTDSRDYRSNNNSNSYSNSYEVPQLKGNRKNNEVDPQIQRNEKRSSSVRNNVRPTIQQSVPQPSSQRSPSISAPSRPAEQRSNNNNGGSRQRR